MTTTQASNQERREFFRLNFKTPVEFISFNPAREAAKVVKDKEVRGLTSNISQSGILFQTETEPPKVSSLVWMTLDLRTLRICQEIEKKALVHNNGILGRVVRVEESPLNRNSFDIGICFLTQEEAKDKQVADILATLPKN